MDSFQLEQKMYRDRKDIWAISKCLKLAPAYRQSLWDSLTPADRELVSEYGVKMKQARAREAGKVKGKA